ncbi:hypothetical protein DFS34DRAFT_629389 [Phlyctochytrium arcticum]|nr:hypothetical protein DFS34DRAFT_629389 [Phlyctochytrium arcticum]
MTNALWFPPPRPSQAYPTIDEEVLTPGAASAALAMAAAAAAAGSAAGMENVESAMMDFCAVQAPATFGCGGDLKQQGGGKKRKGDDLTDEYSAPKRHVFPGARPHYAVPTSAGKCNTTNMLASLMQHPSTVVARPQAPTDTYASTLASPWCMPVYEKPTPVVFSPTRDYVTTPTTPSSCTSAVMMEASSPMDPLITNGFGISPSSSCGPMAYEGINASGLGNGTSTGSYIPHHHSHMFAMSPHAPLPKVHDRPTGLCGL